MHLAYQLVACFVYFPVWQSSINLQHGIQGCGQTPGSNPRRATPFCMWTGGLLQIQVHRNESAGVRKCSCVHPKLGTAHVTLSASFVSVLRIDSYTHVIRSAKTRHLNVTLGETQNSVSTILMATKFKAVWASNPFDPAVRDTPFLADGTLFSRKPILNNNSIM